MCGIAGAINIPEAALVVRAMLHSLQNRGQQAAGIFSLEGDTYHQHRCLGTVANDIPEEILVGLIGDQAIGHNRYATAPNSAGIENIQPIFFTVDDAPIAIAHNGNFTNTKELEAVELLGTPFLTKSDTERFLRLVLREHRSTTLEQSIIATLDKMEGTCSAILTLPGKMIAIRDSWGNRPLYWGKHEDGYVVASETCALDAVGVFDYKEVDAGSVLMFTESGVEVTIFGDTVRRHCSFEWVYFSFPTSEIFGVHTASIREAFGRRLAKEHPVEADVIAGVPDSSNCAALGFAEENKRGALNRDLIVRRHNTGRTFIMPGQAKRKRAVTDKFAFDTQIIEGKRIVLIDDSLVRGTTSRGISRSLRERGATEVHWRIAAPPVTGQCYYGINTAKRELLLAANMTNAEMCADIEADSLEFLSMEGFQSVIREHGVAPSDCCFACMNGEYFHTR
jgi:amidophosphoribosyltransferase